MKIALFVNDNKNEVWELVPGVALARWFMV